MPSAIIENIIKLQQFNYWFAVFYFVGNNKKSLFEDSASLNKGK